jgi:hypothetical protein
MTMARVRCARYFAMLLVTMLPVAPAGAQEVATSFEELRRLVTPGETIYVTGARGAISKGRLAGLSAGSLQLRVDRDAGAPPVSLSESDVNNIAVHRSDPLWNGMLIGFASGAVPVALIGAGSVSASAGEVAVVTAGYGAIGLLTGLLIDFLNKEHVTIYVHRPRTESRRIRLSPIAEKSAVGVRLSAKF